MNRPRKLDRHLPACVYQRGPSLYHVKRGKWTRIGSADDLRSALAEYARLTQHREGGMAGLIEEMLPRITEGRAPATVKLYTLAARKLQRAFVDFAPHEVTPKDVAEFRRGYRDTPGMTNRCMSVLRMIFDEALEDQLVESNPCVGVKRHAGRKRTRSLTVREYAAIRRVAPERLQVVMDLCVLTGQRIGDVLRIRRADLLDTGISCVQQKTGAKLVVAWTPELRVAAEAAKALHGRIASTWLVKGDRGRPLAYQPVWRAWRAACEAAGVEGVRIHDLRAMAATEARRQGRDAQALLGHTSQRMTDQYIRDRDVPVVTGPSIKVST